MSRSTPSLRAIAARPFLFFAVIASPLTAQCAVQWLPGQRAPGIAGEVHAAAFLPNGDLVAGGRFATADAVFADNVARWNGATWQPLGAGVGPDVRALAVMQNGDVVVGGGFAQAGGASIPYLARWNGTTWSALGAGTNGPVYALHVLPNGDLLAGGFFTAAGGVQANRIARWNGTTWSAVGAGVPQINVAAIDSRPNGDIVVGGTLTAPAPGPVAIWNGIGWQSIAAFGDSAVSDVKVLPSGAVAVAGSLLVNGQATGVAVTNGVTTQSLVPPAGTWDDLDLMANGDLVAAGQQPAPFGSPPPTIGNVARWNGTTWTSLPAGAPLYARALAVAANGDLVAAGYRDGPFPSSANAVCRYDGSSWTSLGAPIPARVDAMARTADGSVVVAGQFASIGGIAANNIARRQNLTFVPLGAGVAGRVSAIAAVADGSVVVGGEFTLAGGGPANRIARWTGASWATLGGGLPAAPRLVAAAANGQVLAITNEQLWHFDGSAWSLVSQPAAAQVTTMVGAPEGDFVLGGSLFASPGVTGAVRWSPAGVTYTALGFGQGTVVLSTDAQGAVIAALRTPSTTNQIHRLAGTTWTLLGSDATATLAPLALSVLPNGDPLIAVAGPANTQAQLRRLDGTLVPFGTLLTTASWPLNATYQVKVESTRDGEVLVAGSLLAIGNDVQTGFAIGTPTCPAAASAFGTGCTGAAGPLSLVADNLPWLGGTFRSTATGFTATSLGLHAIGTQPLAITLPLGAPGCSLFVQPDVLDLLLPVNGEAGADFVVPRTAALAGLQARTQVIGIELDATGNLIRLTSTNALQLNLGSL